MKVLSKVTSISRGLVTNYNKLQVVQYFYSRLYGILTLRNLNVSKSFSSMLRCFMRNIVANIRKTRFYLTVYNWVLIAQYTVGC